MDLFKEKKFVAKAETMKKKSSFFYPAEFNSQIRESKVYSPYEKNFHSILNMTRKNNFINQLSSNTSMESDYSQTQEKFYQKNKPTNEYESDNYQELSVEKLKGKLMIVQDELKRVL